MVLLSWIAVISWILLLLIKVMVLIVLMMSSPSRIVNRAVRFRWLLNVITAVDRPPVMLLLLIRHHIGLNWIVYWITSLCSSPVGKRWYIYAAALIYPHEGAELSLESSHWFFRWKDPPLLFCWMRISRTNSPTFSVYPDGIKKITFKMRWVHMTSCTDTR